MNRYQYTHLTGVLGIVGNIFLLIIKAIAGFMSNSQALIADAFNSAGDIFSSFMTFIGNKISSKGADEDHNLGHGKAEYIYSLLISISMFLLSVEVIKNAIIHFIHKEYIVYSNWLLIICLITIVVKIILYFITKKFYDKTKNILILANNKDHRNDIFVTSFTLISIVLSKMGYYYIDLIVGIGISLWIIYTAICLFMESYDVLMDKCMDFETKDKVLAIIHQYPEIRKVNHFNATPVGYRYQISFTIFVDGNMTTFESHDIANRLEREIDKEIPEVYLTVIHVNPVMEKK